jgi:hypothetical protein
MKTLRPVLFVPLSALLACSIGSSNDPMTNACVDLQACCNTGSFPANGLAGCEALTQANDSTACAQELGGYVSSGICGGGGNGVASFVGTWQGSLTTTATCLGMSQESAAVSTRVLVAGPEPDTIVDMLSAGCSETFTVSGSIALASNQLCVIATNGQSAAATFVTDELSLNGTSVAENATGTLSEIIGGQATACTFTMTGTFAKM